MGEPSNFRLTFNNQPILPLNTPSTAPGSQEPSTTTSSASFSSFNSSALSPPQFAAASSSSNTIFGGSAFLRPSENPFATAGRQTIFGGSAQSIFSQSQNVPETERNISASQPHLFGKSPTVASAKIPFIGNNTVLKSTEEASGPVNFIFGGALTKAQPSSMKSNVSSDSIFKTSESTSSIKESVFGGGSYLKRDEYPLSTQPVAFEAREENSDSSKNSTLFGIPTLVSIENVPPTNVQEKNLSAVQSNPSFGEVSLSVSHQTTGKDREASSRHSMHEAEHELLADNITEENDGNKTNVQSRLNTKTTKINRKRGIFGKAIEDVTNSSRSRQSVEGLKSFKCFLLEGELPDQSVIKNYFSKFGQTRVTIDKEKRYFIATFKTHEEARKAMKENMLINNQRYKTFWRNSPKARRRSSEELDKEKPVEGRKKTSKIPDIELDPAVIGELEAMLGLDYNLHSEVNSKRKANADSDGRKKSRTPGKLTDSNLGTQENKATAEVFELGKRNSSHLRNESSKELKSKTFKASKEDEKSAHRSRTHFAEKVSRKAKDDHEESKPEKVEHAPSGGHVVLDSELLQVLKQQALSSEEKLQVLDARDKLIRMRQVKQYDISKAVKTVGTCPDMCPEKERLLRETRRQISQYEMNSFKTSEMDPNKMVKQYSRSSADQEEPLPHDLRPPSILTMTMNYLLHSIMNLGDEPGENLGEWYHFLWDRLRGIRKEITQQELCDIDGVRLVEQCARFHIHCGARLVAEDMSVFDDRINTENLTKCLQTLKHMYHDLWINNSIVCPNEPEFITYFILLNLNNGTIMWEMEQLREEALRSPEISFVTAMYNSLSSNNFVRFFRLVRKATYLNSCLCIRYFYQVRARALSTYVKALAKIRPVNYPLANLVEELGFENAECAAAFCNHHNLQVENESACVVLSQDTFINPDTVLPSERAIRLVESKRVGSVGEVVNGGPLPAPSHHSHVVHNSFDENGFLKKTAYFAKDQGAVGSEARDREVEMCVEEMEETQNVSTMKEIPRFESTVNTTQPSNILLPQASTSYISSVAVGKEKTVFPSTSTAGTGSSVPLSSPSILTFNSTQTPASASETVRFNSLAPSTATDSIKRLSTANVFQNFAVVQNQKKIEAEKQAQVLLEKEINESSEKELEGLLNSVMREETVGIASDEVKAADEQHRAEQKLNAEKLLQAQEDLRKRIVNAQVDKISNESLLHVVDEVVSEVILQLAQEVQSEEYQLLKQIDVMSEECLETLILTVTEEECYCSVSVELKRAKECARQEAVEHRVRQIFYQWLQRARCSLHRKSIMKNFPASVIPLSIKEHAERWGFPEDVLDTPYKRREKSLDLSDLKATPADPQATFAELIGIQVVHRYDTIRTKLGLGPTDQVLYKLFISVPEVTDDPAVHLVDWWIRRTFRQDRSMLHDDSKKGTYRLVSGLKVTSEVAVYSSVQMVRGELPLIKQCGLASGTSAVLFTVSPISNVQASCLRLNTLLRSISKMPPVPLVVAVVSPSEPPLEGLKQLVLELQLDQWLHKGVICDYQILHVNDHYDIKYLYERFNMAFNYMVMTWTPSPEFSLVCLRNVLKSTFQMFFISIQFNYNSSEVYPQDIDDPRVIIGLCNEWLELMCQEFISSFCEAQDLCAVEFWPLIHKGAFLPFFHNQHYTQFLEETMQSLFLPSMDWPPKSEQEFVNLMSNYCSWLRPTELKQTQKRLSCLNGLSWSEKIKSVPWINLVEDWMEARLLYAETSTLCGSELLCLMRAQNVEHLYTHPWWARSKYITWYLETHQDGSENNMDIDLHNGSCYEETVSQQNVAKSDSCGNLRLATFDEVKNTVKELKSANESLMTRIRGALADSFKDNTLSKRNVEYTEGGEENKFGESFVKSSVVNTKSSSNDPLLCDGSNTNSSFVDKVSEVGQGKDLGSFKDKMIDIMTSVEDIVSSLNKKYQILDSSSSSGRITDLKMGVGDVDVSCQPLSKNLYHSSYVQESQLRMKERLQRATYLEDSKDSVSEVMSEERSLSPYDRTISSPSSPSSQDSENERSRSDAEYSAHSRRRKKRHLKSESEDDVSYDGSSRSPEYNESISMEEQEVQTVSSEDSREHSMGHLANEVRSGSPSSQVNILSEGEQNNSVGNDNNFDSQIAAHNIRDASSYMNQEPERNLMNNHSYLEESEELSVENIPDDFESENLGDSQPWCDPIIESVELRTNEVELDTVHEECNQSGHNYQSGTDEESGNGYGEVCNESGGIYQSVSDEENDDGYGEQVSHSKEKLSEDNSEDSESDMEPYEDLEEEELEAEEECEVEEECEDEEEVEEECEFEEECGNEGEGDEETEGRLIDEERDDDLIGEEEEEDFESDMKSEVDDDSDVCEVIDE